MLGGAAKIYEHFTIYRPLARSDNPDGYTDGHVI